MYIIEKRTYDKPQSYKLPIINATQTIVLVLFMTREFGLKIYFELMGIRIQYDGGMKGLNL